MNISRKAFFSLASLSAAQLIIPSKALADETDYTLFTDELALELASEFTNDLDTGLVPYRSTKLYDASKGAIGYVIELKSAAGAPHGYIIFDVTNESLISEFSFAEDTTSPFLSLVEKQPSGRSSKSIMAYKSDPFTYVGFDTVSEEFIYPRNYPTRIIEKVGSTKLQSTTWNDIFFPSNLLTNPNYTVVEEAYTSGQFISYSDDEIIDMTNSYACAVVAMLCCAAQYIPYQTFYSYSLEEHYWNLWERSGTTAYDNPDGLAGVTYGSTSREVLGRTLRAYCSQLGAAIFAEEAYNPLFSQFTSMVNSFNCGIFSCGLSTLGRHAMAVQGYMRIKPSGIAGGQYLDVLCVADGWHRGARYLNPSYASYVLPYGIFFSRG
ncbi:MAG: hypothetical protein Q4B91_01750 [Atopobiaceae bacterium]|nr:hypothetical protein [Atopobiaceae bacterium]